MNDLPDDPVHLLIIDDDTRIRDLLRRYLSKQGFLITTAADAEEARRRLKGIDFDLLVIDVMMPGESGLSLTSSLRKIKDVPILMLTALAETEARIAGLEAGADDYLGKPFEPKELLLRINAILRRKRPEPLPLIPQIMFGPYTFIIESRELKKNGKNIHLTERERELMSIFAKQPNETIPRLELAGDDDTIGDRTIDVQINRLRRRIETDPSDPMWLQTIRGIGYELSTD